MQQRIFGRKISTHGSTGETVTARNNREMKASTRFVLGLFGIVLSVFLVPGVSRGAQTVAPGWDLFSTPAGHATFGGQSFEGVPLGTFDFGGKIGVRGVGNTDTIVQRLSAATAPISTIPAKLDALQLESVNSVDFGLGTGHYFVTLQSNPPVVVPPTTLTIAFGTPPGTGTLHSYLNVPFDIRKDSLTGPIAISSSLALTGTAPWSHDSPAGALLINGVNHLLNGTDTSENFWPTNLMEMHPSGAMHNPVTAVPETINLVGAFAVAGFCGYIWFRRGRALRCS